MNLDLSFHLKHFLQVYLREQRSLSPHTIKSYRDTFKLLATYLHNRCHVAGALSVTHVDVKNTLAFLQYLESSQNGRGNSARTRNQRLTVIQSFFTYLSLHHPSLETHAKRILAIPFKRADPHVRESMTRPEIEAVMAQPQVTTSDGIRDLAILAFLYNAGARAQEVADLRLDSFDFATRTAKIVGKGNKPRTTPLWPSTVRLLKLYRERHRRQPHPAASSYFFINQRGDRFTRFGIRFIAKKYIRRAVRKCPELGKKTLSTHSFRHTTASHLRQSRVEQTAIRDWLGHKSVASTDPYIDTDIHFKRRVLEQFGPPPNVASLDDPEKPDSDDPHLDWLKDL